MHGVKRDRHQLSAELKAQRKEKEKKKLQVYKSIEDQFFAFRNGSVVTLEALDLTTHLLHINPELYTAWNYRRKILDSLFKIRGDGTGGERSVSEGHGEKDFFASARVEETASSPEKSSAVADESLQQKKRKMDLLVEDLALTIEVLKIHPKVYWIWNHRKWCLKQLPSDDAEGIAKWAQEIQMVNKMLDMDARNCECCKGH
jgi:geranylgeranyl transferase type-2 subunit alpha